MEITLVGKKSDFLQLTLISYVVGVSESEQNIENNPRRAVCEKTGDKKIYSHYLSNNCCVLSQILKIFNLFHREYNCLKKFHISRNSSDYVFDCKHFQSNNFIKKQYF